MNAKETRASTASNSPSGTDLALIPDVWIRAMMAATVTIDKAYFETLLRR